MVPERQAWAKEVASSSDSQQKPDSVAYMQVHFVSVLHCQSLPLEVAKRERVAGRLVLLLDNWSKVHVTPDWVLNTVQGYRIEFLETPVQTTHPRVGVRPQSGSVLIARAESHQTGVLLKPFPGSKEGRRQEASTKLEEPQRVST